MEKEAKELEQLLNEKEEEAKKQAELEKYFEEYEREHRSESLGEIHKRVSVGSWGER